MDQRRDPRLPVTMQGRYRPGNGRVHDVQISDLSLAGCRMYQNHSWLEVGSRISLRIETIGPILSIVRWKDRYEMGVEFETPLHPSVLDHLAAHFDRKG
ncbi:MAG: PilZ domain-containing protein [Novosphingobium sp.]|nr:PilZ domain-containing protein [Novosphingobium sp.]